jgi:hypothetical protein
MLALDFVPAEQRFEKRLEQKPATEKKADKKYFQNAQIIVMARE